MSGRGGNGYKDLRKCIWKYMAEDPNSTTFQDITPDKTEHKLYICKYMCYGYGVYFNHKERYYEDCDNYRPLAEMRYIKGSFK